MATCCSDCQRTSTCEHRWEADRSGHAAVCARCRMTSCVGTYTCATCKERIVQELRQHYPQ